MRVLATADVHVEDWRRYEVYPGFRLDQYNRVAEWFLDIIESYKVDLVAIAGDFFHKPVNPPKVLLTGIRLINSISSKVPVVMIHGQHDLDVRDKSSSFVSNSLVSLVKETNPNRVFYLHQSSVEVQPTGGGVSEKVFGYGWEPTFSPNLEEAMGAKLVLLHGQVRGSRVGRVVFEDGFDPSELFPGAYIVVGDVHQYQVFSGGRVIVPGPPIHHTASDGSAGVVVLDTDSGDHEYLPSGYVSGQRRYLFLQIVSSNGNNGGEKLDKENLIVYRSPERKVAREEVVHPSRNPLEIIKSMASEEGLSEVFEEALSETVEYKDSPYLHPLFWRPLYLSVENFRSIESLSLDFSSLGRLVYITGPNGSGKSSLLSAIRFVLLGEGGKDVISLGKSYVKVHLRLEYMGQEYEITRTIEGSQSLEVVVGGKVLDAPSLREKQSRLEDLLPFIKVFDQISYFDQFRPGFISSLSPKQRVDLISDIFGLSFVSSLLSTIDSKVKSLQSEFNSLQAQVSSVSEGLKAMESIREELSSSSLSPEEEEEYSVLSSIVEEAMGELRSCELERQKYLAESSSLSLEISKVSKNLEVLTSTGKCYVCGSPLVAPKSKELASKLLEQSRSLEERKAQVDARLSQIEESVSKLTRVLEKVKARYEYLSTKSSHHRALLAQYERIKKQLEQVREGLESLTSRANKISYKIESFKSLSKMIQTRAYVQILENVSRVLSDENLGLNVKTKQEFKNGSVKPTVDLYYRVKEGTYLPFELLSGGQRTIADLKFFIRLISVFDGVGIIVFDETWRYLDPQAYEEVFSLISDVRSSHIFYVSHDISPALRFDTQISVSNVGGVSVYDIDS